MLLKFDPPIPPPHVEIVIGPPHFKSDHKIAIFADAAIADTHGKTLQRTFGGELFPIPGKEASKSRAMKERLEDALSEKQFGRDTTIVALGGGVICDLAGFIASTYLRGVELILIPTTLLAMVDAAVGGKTGINTPYGKNLIGAFYHPQAVFIDLTYLSTLPSTEWTNGLAEILKYGLIFDAAIWDLCEAHADDWQTPPILESLVLSSLKALIQILEQDPLEQTGYRRILNFGHTAAHALEHLSHYTIPHGMAVAIGSVAESFLSAHLGYLPSSTFQRIQALYSKLPLHLPSFDPKQFLNALQYDKKTKQNQVRCVLIDQIGHALPFNGDYCCPIDPIPLAQWIQKTYA